MYLTEAPTNASGLTMVIVAVVMMFSLGAWLGLVFLADRQPRARRDQASQIEEHRQLQQHKRAA